MIILRIQPEFSDSQTEISVNGEHEEMIANVITSTYLNSNAEVFVLDNEGEWVAAEEMKYEDS